MFFLLRFRTAFLVMVGVVLLIVLAILVGSASNGGAGNYASPPSNGATAETQPSSSTSTSAANPGDATTTTGASATQTASDSTETPNTDQLVWMPNGVLRQWDGTNNKWILPDITGQGATGTSKDQSFCKASLGNTLTGYYVGTFNDKTTPVTCKQGTELWFSQDGTTPDATGVKYVFFDDLRLGYVVSVQLDDSLSTSNPSVSGVQGQTSLTSLPGATTFDQGWLTINPDSPDTSPFFTQGAKAMLLCANTPSTTGCPKSSTTGGSAYGNLDPKVNQWPSDWQRIWPEYDPATNNAVSRVRLIDPQETVNCLPTFSASSCTGRDF